MVCTKKALLVLIVLYKHARLQEESLVQPAMLLAFYAEGFAIHGHRSGQWYVYNIIPRKAV